MSTLLNSKYVVQKPKYTYDLENRNSMEEGVTVPFEVYLDKDTLPGTTIYSDITWVKNQPIPAEVMTETEKPFHTVLFFVCNNPHDRRDFGADVEITIDGKLYNISSTSVCFIPAGTKFGPVKYKNVSKPTLFGTIGIGTNDFINKIPNCKYDIYNDKVKEPIVTTTPFELLEADGHDFGEDGYIKNHTCPNQIYLGGEIKKDFPFFMDITWFWDIPYPNPHVGAHRHDYDELVMFISSDENNLRNLDGQVLFYVGEEPHFVNETAVLYLPKGLKHCPMIHTKVNKPMILVTMELGCSSYTIE